MLMTSRKSSLFLYLALLFCLVDWGCGGSSQPTPTELSIAGGAALPNGQVSVAYSATLSAMGGTAPYTWSVTSGGLPAGLTLSSSGLISGTATAAGSSTFTAQVSDAESTPQKATAQLSITIVLPLSIVTNPLANGILNSAYNQSLAATGGMAPYSWTLSSGALPPGLSLSAAGAITGTPTAAGSSSFTVQAADAESSPQKVTAQLSIAIVTPLSIATTSLADGILNSAYNANLAASGGTVPYSWSVSSGALPPGLSLSATGAITGTPTTLGVSNFTVEVADAELSPQRATTQLTINVTTGPLIITTASLLSGTLNAAYAQSLAATGGISPYTWTLASGALPPGLNLSSTGAIAGVPTSAGTFSFGVRVSDTESPAGTATRTLSIIVSAVMPVVTQHYDNSRTGQNLNEGILTPASVSSGQFGKLFSYSVDGDVYAQPLYVPNVNIPGKGIHNVIYIVTEHDSVYALDADSNSGGNSTPLWQASFIDPAHGITPVSSGDVNCDNITPEIGITSTPVIDPVTGTIYVLAKTKENGSFFQRLHALDITTGAEKFGGPTTIQASYNNGAADFDPLTNNNRVGLLQANGNIYLAWASHCDNSPYYGWVIAYDQATLQQKSVWLDTPNGVRGGIWMSGAGLAADAAGKVFVSIGNGTFDTSGEVVDFGDSIVKLVQSGSQLMATDYFTPYDEGVLNDGDQDVGSGGVLLLPDQPGAHPHELIEAGKEGTVYVVDRDNMGHFNPDNNAQIVQNLPGLVSEMFAIPAYWNGNVYFGGVDDHVQVFSLTNGLLSTSPSSQSPTNLGYPGASPIVSSNGTNNGIVWALQTAGRLNNGNEVLHAYDATNLASELYNSAQNQERDNPGAVLHFAVPTVANGKVYTGAVGQVSIFGLSLATVATPTFAPAWGTYTSPQTVAISDSTPGATIYYTTDGSDPTLSSPVYTNPITVSVTTTVKAIASAPQYFTSPIATAIYTILTAGGGSLNYGNGFTVPTGLVLNGYGAINGSRLRLTDGGTGESASAWYTTPVNIQAFTQDFAFQLTNPNGDGFTFAIQNAGTTAIGPGGAGLAYGAGSPNGNPGIPMSVAIKFDLYNNYGEGVDSTGLYTEGASPTIPAIDMTGSGVDLHSGDIFNVHMTYDGSTLTMAITDTVTYQAFTQSWQVDIPTAVGGTTAYVGFTGASGAATATQDVLNWTFASQN